MKYSIFQYSQEKLLENNLDVIDALLLSWFSDFFVGSMEKRIFRDEGTENGKLYGWVKLSKVMEDLPCIGINSEKGIKRRFDSFVEKNIMERKTVITQNGKKAYYRPTELYEALINTKIKVSKNTETEESPHDCQNSLAENKNPQRTKTTVAESKNDEKSPHDYQNILAEGNENILAHGHQNSHALNNSSISDDTITDAAIIKSETDNIFGEYYFDYSFPEKAADFLKSRKMEKCDWRNYLKYIFDKLSEKNANNPRGLAYRLFFQDDIVHDFLRNKQQQLVLQEEKRQKLLEAEKRKATCPACGCSFDTLYFDSCRDCGLSINDFHNIKKIERQKRFNKLTPQNKQNYYSEYLDFKKELNFTEKLIFCNSEEGKKQQYEYVQNLDRKYGLIEEEE